MVILDVSDRYQEDRAYFAAIRAELRQGGFAALLHDLLHFELGKFHPAQVPGAVKQRGWDLTLRSAGSVESWWFDVLERGWFLRQEESYEPGTAYLWPEALEKDQGRSHYLKWCERHRVHHAERGPVLGMKLRSFGLGTDRPDLPNGRAGPRRYTFPRLARARVLFGQLYGIPEEFWDEIVPADTG
jgi:hypothetical protein